ncbi:hypothetical protein [Nostoc sp. C052]|nr:hypothetical protein [Nostoc sp. C052]
MPITQKIDWRFWYFGNHGLVVTMILLVTMVNLYLYRERDYGIKI